MRFRTAVAAASAPLLLLLWAGPALAHVDASPAAVQAGTTATVDFAVEHGCGSQDTTALSVQVPDGVADVDADDAEGFTVTVDDDAVRWEGGSLPTDTSGTFSLTATMPDAEGEVFFPAVQTCGDTETAWIEVPSDGEDVDDLDLPAPRVLLTADEPTDEDLDVAATDASHSHDDDGEHDHSDDEDGEHGHSDDEQPVGAVGAGAGGTSSSPDPRVGLAAVAVTLLAAFGVRQAVLRRAEG